MSAGAFTLEIVEAGRYRLPCVKRGPGAARLIIVPPLFEEMNRTRRLLAQTGAALAAAGITSLLPDLPGTGDHPDPVPDWENWRGALRELVTTVAPAGGMHLFAVRGGTLLTGDLPMRSLYRLQPVTGQSLWRDLLRSRVAADAETGNASTVAALEAASAGGAVLELAGYTVTPALASALRAAQHGPATCPTRTVIVGDDPAGGADGAIPGAPVWRQAEAEDTSAMASQLAADIRGWIDWSERPS